MKDEKKPDWARLSGSEVRELVSSLLTEFQSDSESSYEGSVRKVLDSLQIVKDEINLNEVNG